LIRRFPEPRTSIAVSCAATDDYCVRRERSAASAAIDEAGVRRVLLPLILPVVVLLGCYWAFVYVEKDWPIAPVKRTPEQNQGGNAPQDTSPRPA
jgi:hypothetical protein